MGTTFPQEIEGILASRTDSAQILAESEPPKKKFPKIIRPRKVEVTIYGSKPNYSFYRIACRVAGKRHLRNFSKYGEAFKEAEKIRELAEGRQSAGLSAKEMGDALSVRCASRDRFNSNLPDRNIPGIRVILRAVSPP